MSSLPPKLSAIIISRDDEDTIEAVVHSVVNQDASDEFEVIVVVSGLDRSAEIVRTRFPEVILVALESPALPGKARNAGLQYAKGKYVSFPGSHVMLPPGSLEARIKAHDLGYTMVTGAILNGTYTRAGWAAYFMDHSDSLPGRPSQELTSAPAHCSYVREILVQAGDFPEDMRAGEDTVINARLWENGESAYRDNRIELYHHNRCTTPWRLIKHHFIRGRAWGRILIERGSGFGVISNYISVRYRRTEKNVNRWGGELVAQYHRSRHFILLGICSAYLGIWYERLRNTGLPGRSGNTERSD